MWKRDIDVFSDVKIEILRSFDDQCKCLVIFDLHGYQSCSTIVRQMSFAEEKFFQTEQSHGTNRPFPEIWSMNNEENEDGPEEKVSITE